MRKTMFKTICVFTLVFFVMSMTGAACGNSCSTKTDARNDVFTCKSCKTCSGNVLSNDKGCNLKVTSTGCITTAKGGKVCIQSNGKFTYTKPASCTKSCTDSFKYCVKGKDGKTDCATVKINVKCSSCSSC
ncbi:MAG TPA: hypothetical protein VGK06_06720 [Methanosarcina sp.]